MRRRPASIALEHEHDALTYAELDVRAERLARSILARRLGPNPLVAICVERSAGMLVAVLGTLKANAVCVPFLPDDPPERTAAMVEDTRPALLIASDEIAASWRERRLSPSPLLIDHDGTFRADPNADAASPARPVVVPSGREYVMFTSGSTGRPKAVPMPRESLGTLLSWHLETHPSPVEADCRELPREAAPERQLRARLRTWRQRVGLTLWDRLSFDVLKVGRERLAPHHACQLAQLAHAPRPYAGHVDLFASREWPAGALGWESLVSLTRHDTEGTHESIMADGAAAIARGLERALTRTPRGL